MSYLDKNLIADEKILFRTKKHLIIFFFPIVWTIIAIYLFAYMRTDPILVKVSLSPWLLTIVFWGYVGLEYITSEFAVTDKRVMMREGFFYRHTNETRLSAISQVNVGQSLLGQILNYGTVAIYAFGASDAFSLISKPLVFQQYVNSQVDKVAK